MKTTSLHLQTTWYVGLAVLQPCVYAFEAGCSASLEVLLLLEYPAQAL
jgi:hypothetical protein